VNPGWGGQPFVPGSMEKFAAARRLRDDAGSRFVIEVDGGIKPFNAAEAVACGAEVLVAGSAIFDADDYAAVIRALRGAA
jgi:ribulose-phosphate 3-epimerase